VGICGGTGGGTFLDVPQIVRHLFAAEPMLVGKQYRITGYVVMPDVSLTVANDSSKEVLRRNAYAALKELDFWMQVGTHKTPFTAQYDAETKIAWTQQAPYDRCVLLCGEDTQGKPFENPKDAVCRT
ncbi:tubulin-like doman-containing protein, partial [Vibrio sp. FNV 38]|nr:tubulin-like doman-containing protein [Vibrio sp. FNV 38]